MFVHHVIIWYFWYPSGLKRGAV